MGLSLRERPPCTRPKCRPLWRVKSSRTAPASPCGRALRTMPSSDHSMPSLPLALAQGAFRAPAALPPPCAAPRVRKQEVKERDLVHRFGIFSGSLPRRGAAPRQGWRRPGGPLGLWITQTHLAVAFRVVLPVVPHLDEQEEMHGLLEHMGQFLAGLG